jgi:transcriptional regulator with XRE-family HTH domain
MFKHQIAREKFDKSGRTIAWIAEYIGITASHLREVLNGSRPPSLPVVKLLALALECSEAELLSQGVVAS